MGNSGLTKVVRSIRHLGYKLPLQRVLSSRSPIVLLYHGVPRKSDATCIDEVILEQHILFLKQYCDFVTHEQIGKRRKALDRIRVLLSFDDGMRNHAAVVAPILRRHKVPALFFVCSRHATPGKYLWFTYVRGLERHFAGNGFRFRGEFIDMTPAQRQASVSRLWKFLLTLTPHPAAMYQVIDQELPRLEDFISQQVIADSYAGMTTEQVGEVAADPLFSVGIHTVDHPFLTKCSTQDMRDQIQRNKTWLESICNRSCNMIAYPGGDYNRDVIEYSRNLGIAYGYAVTPNTNSDSLFEIPRFGIYATSLDVLGVKVHWGNYLRRLKVRVG
jgi:peptidoglycan/xylan/chitin deacetylase (PgdA/CDA1 family)